jgi:hypothetical protein
MRIKPLQALGMVKNHIGSELSLGGAPVVAETPHGAGYLFLQWMGQHQEFLQQGGPVTVQLVIQKFLSLHKVLDPNKAVVALTISNPGLIHLMGQPLTTIQTDIHRERKPGLDPYVHQSKFGMLIVMIQMRAFGVFQNQPEPLGLTIPSDLERKAGFHTGKQNNGSLLDRVAFGQLLSQQFLAGLSLTQILNRTFSFAKQPVGFFLDSVSQLLSKTAEVFDQYLAAGQIDF